MSPCYIQRLTPTGLEPVDYTADSLQEAAAHEPEGGVYTVANTYRGATSVLFLDQHFDRMERSAELSGMSLQIDRDRVRRTLSQVIADSDFEKNVRFRITAPRDEPETFIISMEPYKEASHKFLNAGVRVVTIPNGARDDSSAKTTEWMHERQQIRDSLPEGIHEGILLDADGNMMEGTNSNFYAIIDDVIYTAGEGVLPGITQQIIDRVAEPLMPLKTTPVNIAQLKDIDEAFITSSSRGVYAVVEIDGHVLSNDRMGVRTKTLREAYAGRIRKKMRPLLPPEETEQKEEQE